MTIEGGMAPIVNTVHFYQLHIMKTERIALFLVVGFARRRVAIKELLLSSVPHRTPSVKRVLRFISRSNTGTGVLSSPAVTINGLQTCSQTYRELVDTAIDCRRPACTQYSTLTMTDYRPSHGYHTYQQIDMDHVSIKLI